MSILKFKVSDTRVSLTSQIEYSQLIVIKGTYNSTPTVNYVCRDGSINLLNVPKWVFSLIILIESCTDKETSWAKPSEFLWFSSLMCIHFVNNFLSPGINDFQFFVIPWQSNKSSINIPLQTVRQGIDICCELCDSLLHIPNFNSLVMWSRSKYPTGCWMPLN